MGPLVEENSFRVTERGYEIQVRLDWYRSLPLSCIEKLQVKLDGQPVNPDVIRFEINGHEYRLEQMADQVEEFWFVLDPARVSVLQPGKVVKGETHTVEAEISVRAPYIPIGPGKYLEIATRYALTHPAA